MECMDICPTMKVRNHEFKRVKQLKYLKLILMGKLKRIGKKVAPRILLGKYIRNKELEELFQKHKLEDIIQSRRLNWASHI